MSQNGARTAVSNVYLSGYISHKVHIPQPHYIIYHDTSAYLIIILNVWLAPQPPSEVLVEIFNQVFIRLRISLGRLRPSTQIHYVRICLFLVVIETRIVAIVLIKVNLEPRLETLVIYDSFGTAICTTFSKKRHYTATAAVRM